MKKILTLTALLLIVCNMQAQSWTTTLNTVSGNGNFGTINSKAIDFYTGNTKRMSLSPTGILSIVGLVNSAGNFITANSNGELGLWTGIGDGSKILFGDNTWKTFPFAVDGANIGLTTAGSKFGINTGAPTAELDVIGAGKFSTNLTVGGTLGATGNLSTGGALTVSGDLTAGNRLNVTTFAPSTGVPATVFYRINTSTGSTPSYAGHTYKGPCNVWYKDQLVTGSGPAYSTVWTPATNHSFTDLLQIYDGATTPLSVISLGLTNGDGVLAVEPIPGNPAPPKLKINPGCTNDVYICEGGGYTRIAGDGSAGGTWAIGPSNPIVNAQLDVSIAQGTSMGLTLEDPTLASTNKSVFGISNSGRTTLGNGTQPITNAMLTVGQPLKTAPGISLLDNSVTPNLPIFNVWGDGKTEIYSSNTDALTIKDAATSAVRYKVQTDGRTEITSLNTDALVIKNAAGGATNFSIKTDGTTFMNNCVGIGTSPSASSFLNVNAGSNSANGNLITVGSLAVPNAFYINSSGVTRFNVNNVSTGSVFKVINGSTDVFAIRYDGVAFAREVVVTTAAFPDYVFAKDYDLLKLSEVKSFIKDNHRLPKMPSATEVQQNGASLGEIQRLTVEKVEELYLYIFQLEEKIEALNNQVKLLEKK